MQPASGNRLAGVQAVRFRFHALTIDDKPVVVLEIDAAYRHPVQFAGVAFIRIGTYKKRLKDFQEHERGLWRKLDATPFECVVAIEKCSGDEVIRLLETLNGRGVTLVIVTHDSTLGSRAGRQLVRADGRLQSDSARP